MRIYRDLIVLAGLFILIWAGTSYYFSKKEPITVDFFSSNNQRRLAEHLDESFKKQFPEYKNPAVDSAVNVILNRISKKDSIKYQITLLDSDDVNAFATLEGRIYIFTGLIRKCSSPEMLAAVLAHEMGHIKHDHLQKRLVNEVGMSLMISILSGGDPVLMSELSKTALQLQFNRDHEREADKFAREVLVNNNIDPIHFARFMMVIKREQQNKQMFSFLNTHPDTEERIISTTEFTKPENFISQDYELVWDDILMELEAEKSEK